MHFINRILISHIYVFNSYTLYLFYFTFGVSPFLTVIYILIPVLFALFKLFYDSINLYEASKYLFLISLVVFLLNIPFGNLPFAVSLYLILFLWFLLYIIFFEVSKPIIKTMVLSVLFFSINSWSLLPQFIALLDVVKGESGMHDMGSWIVQQALQPLDMFYMLPWIKYCSNISLIFLGISLLIFAIYLHLKNELSNKKESIIFVILFLIVLLLTNKFVDIFPIDIVKNIFTNIILSSIRSYDKTLVFIPFLLLVIVLINTNKRKVISLLLLLSILTTIPFFTGELQSETSIAHRNKNLNYKNAEYSFLVKIPDDYQKVAKISNEKLGQYKILSLPYNVINSVGWSNYPQWKLVGADPTHQLFQHAIIDVNNVGGMFTSTESSYGEMFNDESVNYLWILNFMKVLNIGEVLYHKDVRFDFNQMSYFKIKFLEEQGYLKKIYNGNILESYELNKKYRLPHFYIPEKIYTSNDVFKTMRTYKKEDETKKIAYVKSSEFKDELLPLNENVDILHEEVDPTYYKVSIKNIKNKFLLVFSETYENYWQLFIKKQHATEPLDSRHIPVNKYANGWIIDPNQLCKDGCSKNDDGTYNFEFEVICTPELLENRLEKLIITPILATMLFFIFMSLFELRKRNRK